MAGPVKDNKIPVTVNIPHWPVSDGAEIATKFKLDSFIFMNDFTAAGYGISRVTQAQCKPLNKSKDARVLEGANSVKVVMGPGTGLGQGFLVKVDEDGLYEPFPSEGGHVDFTVKNQEDWDLFCFAQKYIENSNNVENLRAKGKVGRLSIERLCAGPAVPLIYAFMKEKYPELEAKLEKTKSFDQIEAKDIILLAINEKDPLCLKVVEKFTENFGTEAGNVTLKTLPYGGVYLIGGVTAGI
jgi:glucokinase